MGATRESKERVGRAFTEYIDRGIVNLGIGEDGHPDDPSELRSRVHTWSHLWFKQDEHGDLDEAIAELPLSLFDFEYDAVLHHHNTIHPRKMARAHILRMAHGWEHATALRTYLKSQPHLLGPMGFDGLPDQSAFHRAWGRFSDRHQDALETATREIVGAARYRGVPAPAKAFQTEQEQENETGERSERQLTVKKTKEIWEQTQPHLCEEFSLNRAPNWSIPEVGYWSQHAFAGLNSTR